MSDGEENRIHLQYVDVVRLLPSSNDGSFRDVRNDRSFEASRYVDGRDLFISFTVDLRGCAYKEEMGVPSFTFPGLRKVVKLINDVDEVEVCIKTPSSVRMQSAEQIIQETGKRKSVIRRCIRCRRICSQKHWVSVSELLVVCRSVREAMQQTVLNTDSRNRRNRKSQMHSPIILLLFQSLTFYLK